MWVRVSRFEGGSAEFDEGMRNLEEHVLPVARQMAGWKGVLSISSGDRSKGMTLTFWESEQALTDSEEAVNRLRGQAAEAGGDTITGVERYEVVLDEAPAAPQPPAGSRGGTHRGAPYPRALGSTNLRG